MDRSINTYTIQQVSQRAKVSKHTLRFWEKELNGIIVPLRTQGGQRRYTQRHLNIIAEIKRMKKAGLSLNNIKSRFERRKNGLREAENSDKIDMLANQIAEVVKASIYDFLSDDGTKQVN